MPGVKRATETIVSHSTEFSRAYIALTIIVVLSSSVRADDAKVAELRQRMLDEINAARRAYSISAVRLDQLATIVAQRHATDMATHGYFSHWDREGLKPYMRYSLAGGYHAISENLSRIKGIPVREAPQRIIASYLAEQPPNDGHRRTLLDRYATHVGIGIAIKNDWIYVAQEFVRKYVKLLPLPQFAMLNEKVHLLGKLRRGLKFHNVDVFYEPLPEPMSIEQLKRTSSYGLPQRRRSLFKVLPPRARYSDGSRGDVLVTDSGSFTCRIPFFTKRPGVYTIVIWVTKPDAPTPVQATTCSIFVCRTKAQIAKLEHRFAAYTSLAVVGILSESESRKSK